MERENRYLPMETEQEVQNMESVPPDKIVNVLPGALAAHSLPQILNSQLILSAVRQARRPKQTQLRSQLPKLREDIEQNRQSAQHLLQLFPEELWNLIFKQLKNAGNVANSVQSHTVFFKIIFTPQELLFFKVLPHVVPFLGSRPAHNIVNCGRVCKLWRLAVDRFADQYFRVETSPFDAFEVLTQDPVPHFHFKYLLNDCNLLYKEQPFMSDMPPAAHLTYEERISDLDTFGHCFWRVTLQYADVKTYFSQDIYTECVETVGRCKNLKRLRILHCANKHRNSVVQDNGFNDQQELQVPLTLESLEIKGSCAGILAVQNALLKKLGSQLKHVKVQHWDSQTYHMLQWPVLTELEIVGKLNLPVLASLEQVVFRKLQRLRVHWNNSINFVHLFKVVNKFDGLRHLSIFLTEKVANEILTFLVELLTVNQITTLEICSEYLQDGLDIAVLFPLVRNLIYIYGSRHAPTREKICDQRKEPKICNKKRYIQIYDNMYISNVWIMLPRLEKLNVTYDNVSVGHGDFRYTRMGYIRATGSNAMQAQLHSELIQRKRLEKQRYILHSNLGILTYKRYYTSRNETGNLTKNPEDCTKTLRFIIPFLAQPDLLSCRLVCRKWKTIVSDSILDTNIPITLQVPFSSQGQVENFVSSVKENMMIPFFFRTVEMQIKGKFGCVDSVEIILNRLGTFACNLAIFIEIPLELTDVHHIFLECMNQCPNLRSFSLHIPYAIQSSRAVFENMKDVQKITKPKHLETFTFHGKGFAGTETGLSALMEHVLESFADQLKGLVIPEGNEIGNLKLRELAITNFKSISLMESDVSWYCGARRPDLKRLRLCVTQQELFCSDIRDIIYNCRELEFLEMQFTRACRSYERNIAYWELDLQQNLTEFQIVFKDKHQMCLDFLVNFPCIQTLRIIYGRHAVLLNEQFDAFAENAGNNLPALPVRSRENDFIQLTRYLKDESVNEYDKENIYASNVWKVLPKLKTLVFIYCGTEHTQERKVFPRKY